MTATIKGKHATLDAALDQAAAILRASSMPVIAGLGTDAAGGRAALRLAEMLGAAYDHMASEAMAGEIAAVQSGHFMMTTPREAKHRADLLLTIGSGAARFATSLPASIKFADPATEARGRTILCLAPGRDRPSGSTIVDAEAAKLPGLIAMLGAAVKGAPIAGDYCGVSASTFRAFADTLKSARFGVAVWSGSDLDTPGVHALMELLNTLNAETRFSALLLPHEDNAAGIRDLSLWQTGFPGRCGFGRGQAKYDPWIYGANRLAESGEADAAIWISAFRPLPPSWKSPPPLIALTGAGAAFQRPPEVHFHVGIPGVDHAGEVYDAAADSVIALAASAPGNKPSVAFVLDALGRRLDGGLS